MWEWAARNLSAAAERLLSPAERMERTVAPWSTCVAGLVIGKPLGILLASGLAILVRLAVAPEGWTLRQRVGAACLCRVGDTMALLMADLGKARSKNEFRPPQVTAAWPADARNWCTNAITMLPSPTAAATRFTESARTSPTAKIPGAVVSSR